MSKLVSSIKKEFLLLVNDKVGLLLMYLMPVLLVFIITIVQDSTFRLVNENRIEILVINKDKGIHGESLITSLNNSGSFSIVLENNLAESEIQRIILEDDHLIAIEIPSDFSLKLNSKAEQISNSMLKEFGLIEDYKTKQIVMEDLKLYYDPVLQENFKYSILSSLYSYMSVLENRLMVENLYTQLGQDAIPEGLERSFADNRVGIQQIVAGSSSGKVIPNATQHNVPAWSIFAMFFMVISLGGNIVKERLSGSFIRLQTIPSSFSLVLVAKMIIYMFVALSQLSIIFLLGKYIFPYIGLPALLIPSNFIGLIVVSIASALAAISFAMLVGTYAKTQDQASGFGAITIIILAAIGGVWVPTFVMPEYLQTIGKISPLRWCLEGFYTLFLKGGDWYLLYPALLFLILFTFGCQILIYIKLKLQNYI